jgi:hypothetical protein
VTPGQVAGSFVFVQAKEKEKGFRFQFRTSRSGIDAYDKGRC